MDFIPALSYKAMKDYHTLQMKLCSPIVILALRLKNGNVKKVVSKIIWVPSQILKVKTAP